MGLAIILLSFPIPGLVGKLVHGVQTNLLQMTDSRVSKVVEGIIIFEVLFQMIDHYRKLALNMIRMIKLFGWQKKMGEKVQETRDEELKLLWRREFLGLSNNIIKYVQIFPSM